jgi:hypothetical protein
MSAVSIRFGSHSRHFRPGLFQPTGTIGVALATRFQPTGARQRSIIRRRTFQSTLLGLKARLAVLMPERISIRLPHRTTNPRGCMVSIQVAEETIRARCLDRYIVSIHAPSDEGATTSISISRTRHCFNPRLPLRPGRRREMSGHRRYRPCFNPRGLHQGACMSLRVSIHVSPPREGRRASKRSRSRLRCFNPRFFTLTRFPRKGPVSIRPTIRTVSEPALFQPAFTTCQFCDGRSKPPQVSIQSSIT